MEESALLKKIYKMEKDLHLEDIVFNGIPIWRIIRYKSRVHLINKYVDYNIGKFTISVGKSRLSFFSGFWKFLWLKSPTICFPFGRLALNNGEYLDKFTDPVLSQTIKDNFIIVDPYGFNGNYRRVHKEHTIVNEHRTISRQILRTIFKVFVKIKCPSKITRLLNQINEPFCLNYKLIKELKIDFAIFFADYLYFLFWFNLIKPCRVFVVFREGYFSVIAACKRLSIPVAEFQHGITLDNTVSFTGDYDSRIDPDYFLVFGDYFKGPQFGMPLDRIVNIGWAYRKYLQETTVENTEKHDKVILVISSPEISDAILDTLQDLSKNEGDFRFDIRLHPCESYNEAQQEKLKKNLKAQVVDNKIDSALVLPTYKYVVGENSSVIYEALSVGCKVGMLNMCGLRPAIDLPGIKDNFFVISNREDFKKFLTEESNQSTSKTEFYSEFDGKKFMEFVNEKM